MIMVARENYLETIIIYCLAQYSNKEISVMDPFIKPPETYRPVTLNRVYQSDLNIAVQSALAAALCLGLWDYLQDYYSG